MSPPCTNKRRENGEKRKKHAVNRISDQALTSRKGRPKTRRAVGRPTLSKQERCGKIRVHAICYPARYIHTYNKQQESRENFSVIGSKLTKHCPFIAHIHEAEVYTLLIPLNLIKNAKNQDTIIPRPPFCPLLHIPYRIHDVVSRLPT